MPPSERVRIRRLRERARYDREAVHAVLDAGLVAHVGIAVDGQPYVLPMAYARDGDRVVLHGSVASRLMRGLASGSPVCITVTLLDGLVLARSAFHHSMNYRSVVVLGTATQLTDAADVEQALDALVDHAVAGRSAEVRPPSRAELRQTVVLAVPIAEGSVKSRAGGANDDVADLALPHWAGEIPLGLTAGTVVDNADLAVGIDVPDSVLGWSPERPRG